MVKDLVCEMEVDESAAKYTVFFEGEQYFFCSEGCRAEFYRRPLDYLTPPDSRCAKPLQEKPDV